MTINLRDHLLAALSTLSGVRDFHIHVLVSAPKKSSSLFPFAKPRPKIYLQDILILLSEQPTPAAPRVLVAAVEAFVFNIPATSCAVLYVCKVDSTGQSSGKSPTTCLVRALLTFYGDPATRPVAADHLWIQLFARAQGQYLFPNSADFQNKRPLSDVKLCGWWKRVLSQVAEEIKFKTDSKAVAKPYYLLPGYSQLEAEYSLRLSSVSTSDSDGPSWVYGHPYSQSDIPLPCPIESSSDKKAHNLGNYIPYFEDDPKSRFLDEIAYTTDGDGVRSPARKRSRTTSSATHNEEANQKKEGSSEGKQSQNTKDERPLGELGKVTADEFWERMSFRQECIAGAVTGFFTLIISTSSLCEDAARRSIPSPLAPQPGQVSAQLNKRIMTSLTTAVEFSTIERSVRATETLESAIKGLCDGITCGSTAPPPSTITRSEVAIGRQTPEPEGSSTSRLLVPPSTPPRQKGGKVLDDVSPNPFPEPVTSLETYHSYIYGSVSVSNPIPARVDGKNIVDGQDSSASTTVPQVTILTARKKKKRND
ncbi:DUF1714 domain-containing protein [Cyathus striatus]|nr:DUF1714 domain-containing protein [Cyathus striatus]